MKILLCIPIIKGAEIAKEAINQVINRPDVEVVLLDNGADDDVKNLINSFSQTPNVTIISYPQNVYVTEAWNRFMKMFFHSSCDRLIIMNSDLTMQKDWDTVVRNCWEFNPNYILTPVVLNDKTKMFEDVNTQTAIFTQVENPAGIFITLNKKQCELVYPIPSEIKVWFNDTYIMKLLGAHQYEIVVPYNLLAYHHTSTSVSSVSGVHAVIEEDKKAWANIVEPYLNKQIELIKSKLN